MLKAAANAAQCFLADAQVRSYMAKRHPFKNMRRLNQQVFISFSSRFKLCVYISLLQPYVIFFVRNPHQPFYFVVLVKKTLQLVFRNGP